MKRSFSALFIIFIFFIFCTASDMASNRVFIFPKNEMTPERERSTKIIVDSLQVSNDRALEISRLFQIIGVPEIVSVEILFSDETTYLVRFVDVNSDAYRIVFDIDNSGSFNVWSEGEEKFVFSNRR